MVLNATIKSKISGVGVCHLCEYLANSNVNFSELVRKCRGEGNVLSIRSGPVSFSGMSEVLSHGFQWERLLWTCGRRLGVQHDRRACGGSVLPTNTNA